jgi:teichuronic acid biosynthesis glycosyltransferase TuaC
MPIVSIRVVVRHPSRDGVQPSGDPVVVTARGSDINLFRAFRSIRPQIRWTLERASGVIGGTAPLKDTMVVLGIARETIKVIGNGVDLARFEPIDSKETKNQLGIPTDARAIVSFGALTPVKGFQILIPSLATILRRYPKARLYIVGEEMIATSSIPSSKNWA